MAKKGLMDRLTGAQENVQLATEQVKQVIQENQVSNTISQDYGERVAQAIERYAAMTADFIEAIGEQMVNTAESYQADSRALADNIRKIAELEAQRCCEFTQRMREAGTAMAEVKKNFERATGLHLNGGQTAPRGLPDSEMKALQQQIVENNAT